MSKIRKIVLFSVIGLVMSSTIVMTVLRAIQGNARLTDDIGTELTEELEYTDTIKIYVTGEVRSPGIVEVAKGSTILDAVEECGGFTENASRNINLVYSLTKNVTLIIKGEDDGGGARVLEKPGDAILIDDENGMIDGLININNADADALSLLPGIGEKTAQDIIIYRTENGLFRTIEDIMNVPGIKDSKFNKIREYICVE